MAESVAGWLARTGVSPTQLTLAGLLLSMVVAVVLGAGYPQIGGVLLLVTAPFDMLDGALARVSQRVTVFGAFLDSTLDRYAEAAILLALLYDAVRRGAATVELLTFLVVVGSLLVSYTRARAEGLGLNNEVGIAPRPERIVILGLGLILGLEAPALVLLAFLTHVTAIQRIVHVHQLTEQQTTVAE